VTAKKEDQAAPATVGWRRLRKWMKASKGNSIAELARRTGAREASAHAWAYRNSRPTGARLRLIIALIGGSEDEWLTAKERKSLAKLQQGAA